jgi:chemotaxis protein MotB
MKKISNTKKNDPMRKVLIISSVAGLAIIMSSCGSSKKLAATQDELSKLQAQVVSLTSENKKLNDDVANMTKQVSDLQSQNSSMSTEYSNYKKQSEANAEKCKQVSATLDEFHKNVEELVKKIQDAETNFNSKGFEVYSKNGVVYVDMQDKLLYKSGSAKLSADGKEALGNLSTVLNEYPNLPVTVEGNTDTVHVKGVADNWSLSTERANGVVRTLVKDGQVDPARLTAAGKGKFNPIADNSTEDGRAKNRRTEIILNPNWDKLWESVQSE